VVVLKRRQAKRATDGCGRGTGRAPALQARDGSFNGKPALVLMIKKQPDMRTPSQGSREVEERIAASADLPE